ETFVTARIGALSAGARAQLLVAAALANPTVEVLAAASDPGAGAGLREAEPAGLIEIDGGRVPFAHPPLASAVYSSAPPDARPGRHPARGGHRADGAGPVAGRVSPDAGFDPLP